MSKIRISLYNPDNAIPTSDRLVESNIEFSKGPQETHEGPIRIETLLESSDQVAGLIQYLQQLSGKLPLSPREQKKLKSKSEAPLAQHSVDKLLEDVQKKGTFQETLIEYLRSLNFTFVTFDHLKDIYAANNWNLAIKHPNHEQYQYMIKLIKLAKDPKNDKYDPQITFGMKVVGKKISKVLIYQNGNWHANLEIHWKEGEEVQFKVKEKFYKFPEPMSYAERTKWRMEDRKLHTDKNLTPSPFYTRWEPFVKRLKPLNLKKKKKHGK